MLPAATSVYHELEDISHFSFFPRCKPGATEILAAAGEGDEVICSDGGGRDRRTLHAHFVDLIKTFLSNAGFKTPTES
jgi:predicted dienelactone hydrolase